MRNDEDPRLAVICVDQDARGESDVSVHARLGAARAACIAWVGEPREVDRSDIPPTVWGRITFGVVTGGRSTVTD